MKICAIKCVQSRYEVGMDYFSYTYLETYEILCSKLAIVEKPKLLEDISRKRKKLSEYSIRNFIK